MKAAVDSADPHLLFTPNRNVQQHVFEPLIFQDAHLKPLPGLAESWRPINPTTWEFKLRRNVTFHDGTPFTARDVAFSIKRGQGDHRHPDLSPLPQGHRRRRRRR